MISIASTVSVASVVSEVSAALALAFPIIAFKGLDEPQFELNRRDLPSEQSIIFYSITIIT